MEGLVRGPSFNSHGYEAVDARVRNRRAPKVRHQTPFHRTKSAGPTGLDLYSAGLTHGLTAVTTECRAFGAVGGMLTRTVDVHVGWLHQKLEDGAKEPRHFLTMRSRL